MKSFKTILALMLLSGMAMSCILSFDDSCGSGDYSSWDDSQTNQVIIGDDETVTNDIYHTNTIVYSLGLELRNPIAGNYYRDSIPVDGFVTNTEELRGAIIYLESTNGSIASSGYSQLEGNSFSSLIDVDTEGYYYIWATAWDASNAMGMSERVSVAVDWTAPELTLISPETTNATLTADYQSGTASFNLSGTAYDAISGVEGVYIYGGACGQIFSAQGTEEWSYSLSLEPGVYSFEVYARDNAGYISAVEEISVTVYSNS